MSTRARFVVVLAFAAAAPLAYAANPFLGRWSLEAFGQTDELVLEFLDDTQMRAVTGGVDQGTETYILDASHQLLTLTIEEGQTVIMRYTWLNADTFELYMGDDLLEQMTQAFTGSMPYGVNRLTDEIADKLKITIREVFAMSPFMRGKRIP